MFLNSKPFAQVFCKTKTSVILFTIFAAHCYGSHASGPGPGYRQSRTIGIANHQKVLSRRLETVVAQESWTREQQKSWATLYQAEKAPTAQLHLSIRNNKTIYSSDLEHDYLGKEYLLGGTRGLHHQNAFSLWYLCNSIVSCQAVKTALYKNASG